MASIRTRRLKTGEPRYDVIWVNPSDGRQDTRTFKKKVHATRFKATVEADLARGTYLDPNAGDVTFRDYAEEWRSMRTSAITSQVRIEGTLRVHVYPVIGHMPLAKIRPSSIQALVKSIDHLAPKTQEQVLKTTSSVFAAAVEDELLRKNPCLAKSVSTARVEPKRVVPWTSEQVVAMHREMPPRYAILVLLGAGLGLRQGETYGISPDDIDSRGEWVTVRRQIRQLEGSKLHFAAPKNEKVRKVPLPTSVSRALMEYRAMFPPRSVTLPWNGPGGKPVTVSLFVTGREGSALNRNYVNTNIWKPALIRAGMAPVRENGSHALRHHYASVLLDAGESIKALSEYLGHADVGFTLRTYTHLMPQSSERTRAAIDAALSLPAAEASSDVER